MGVLLQSIRHPESTQYNLPIYFFMPLEVPMEQIVDILRKLINSFPELHTRFVALNQGEIRQWSDMSLTIPIVSRRCSESELQAYISDGFVRPFNLFSGDPLFRVEVVETEKSLYLLSDSHHSIIDGISLARIMTSALTKIAEGGSIEPQSYGMYQAAEDEVASFGTPLYQRAKDYHVQKFAGQEMVTLSHNQFGSLGRMGRCIATIDRRKCVEWCHEHDAKPSMLLQAAFAHVMSVLTGKKKIVFAVQNNGRGDKRLRGCLGMFVKSLPILINVDSSQKVASFVKSQREEMVSAIKNSIYPFTHFCSDLGMRPGVMFNFMAVASMSERVKLGGKSQRVVQPVRSETDSDIIVSIYLTGEDYEIRVESSLAMNDKATLQMVAEAIKTTACNMMAHSEAPLSELDIVSADERAALITLGSGKQLDIDQTMTFVKAFEQCVSRVAHNLAVADDKSSMTYSELSHASNVLARRLTSAGVCPGDFVAVMLDRTINFPLAVIGIHKAGAAYVPIDLEYPEERRKYMVNDVRPKIVIDSQFIADIDFTAEEMSIDLSSPDGLAYMIYTSGSTGRPKGVMVGQRGLSSYIASIVDVLRLSSSDHISLHRPFSFDSHIHDLYPVLTVGGSLHIMPSGIRRDIQGIRDFIIRHGITGGSYTTSLGTLLIESGSLPLRYMTLTGERMVGFVSGDIQLFNGYGPTECTDLISVYRLERGRSYTNIPIGRPMANSHCFIVDAQGRLLPRGAEGELCFASPQVSVGYWHQPELTAEKFCDCPFLPSGENGHPVRMYHTGDLCRWNEEGQLEFLGRTDDQVKLRGYRIEPGEIESCASGFKGVSQAVAVIRSIAGSDTLCLYYTVNEPDTTLDTDQLRQFLSHKLADYMVPAIYMQLDTLPQTPSGKVDRRRLPEPAQLQEAVVAPFTDLERRLFDIVAQQLGTDHFGVTTNLVTLGLTSLTAMRIIMSVRQQENIDIPVSELLEIPTVRHMAETSGCLSCTSINSDKVLHTNLADFHRDQESYPLTANQYGVYIDWELNRNTTQYNLPVAICLGQTDAAKLANALRQVVDAHSYIKTRLSNHNGNIVQLRRDNAPVQISTCALDSEPGRDFFQQRVKPFNLFTDDLYRLEIYTFGKHTWLFKDFHHIVSDGLSDVVFFRDMLAAYDGTRLEGETVTAFDYALYEQQLGTTDRYAEAREYFDSLISGTEAASYPQSASGTEHKPGSVMATVADSEAIRSACCKMGITPNSYFQTVVSQVLHRLTRQEHLMLATVSSGRALAGTERIMGMFVKTLPMVSKVSRVDISFATAAQAMHRQSIESMSRDFYSLTEIVEHHGLRPEILYAYEGDIYDSMASTFGTDTDVIMLSLDTQKMPIELMVYPDRNETYTLLLNFDSALYSHSSMTALADALTAYATNAAQEGIMLGNIELTTNNQRTALIALGTGKYLDINTEKTFVTMFEERALLVPDSLAVVDGTDSMTYGELSHKSNVLAHQLIECGVCPGDFVAVKLDRTIDFPLAVIAIHKAGAAYVPIDLEYPEKRQKYMLDDCNAKIVIDSQFMTEMDSQVIGKLSKDKSIDLSTPDGLAYMIYTSGSMGRPKGVMIGQRGLGSYIASIVDILELSSSDRISLHRPFSFDAHIQDLYPVLTVGGSLHIMPSGIRRDIQGIRDFIIRHGITGGSYTTSLGTLLIESGSLPLRYMTLTGERMVGFVSGDIQLFNGYGPTECTDLISVYRLERGRSYTNIPIGRPMANSHCFIVDAQGRLLPRGAEGELCFASPQVSVGYWHQPELTAEKFCDCPFLPSGENGHPVRMYHTGDLCRWNEEGQLEFLGRTDDQVKLRGYRIEPGEIESCASGFKGVSQAVAVIRSIAGSDTLCLYYTVNEPDTTLDTDQLRQFLSHKLADYMVPAIYMQLDTLPQTPSGKVDRRRLPEPSLSTQVKYIAPQNKAEETIIRLISDVLSCHAPISMLDNFFALGGDSIKLIHLVSLLHKEGFTALVSELMKCNTVRDMARILVSSSEGPTITQEPVTGVITPSVIQQRFLSWHLSQPGRFTQSLVLRALQPIHAIHMRQALQELAVHHDMLRATIKGSIVIRPTTDEHLFAFVEMTLNGQTEVAHAIVEAAFRQGELIDVEHGPILRVILFHTDDGDRLLLVCHHIAIDGVSWRILVEDLTTALTQLANGQTIVLPPKTHSFAYWTETIGLYRDSYLLRLEKPYWQNVQAQMENMVLTSITDGKRTTRQLTVTLEGEPLRQLLTVSAKAYNTEINDLLVTALSLSYRRMTGNNSLTIQMEGHGREPLHKFVVSDRTIGWFTSVYPVVIQNITGDLRHDVRQIKEQLRIVPNKGIGYGILQYVTSQEGDTMLRTDLTPLIGFNYLGEVGRADNDEVLLTTDNNYFLADSITAGELGVPIPSVDINCGIVSGRFVARFEYDVERWNSDMVQQLANAFVEGLVQVAAHTAHVTDTEPTASDFGATGWTEKQLQDITNHLSVLGLTLQRVYPLSPMQQSILIAYLSNRDTTAYRLLFRLSMSMLPTETILRHTLDYLATKHEVLRTAIFYDGVPQPCQAIVSRQLGLEMRDLTSEPDIDAAAAAIHQEVLHRRLSLTDDALFHVVCMKTGADSCQLLIVMHHIIIDGWCIPIIFRDFLKKMEAETSHRALTAITDQSGRYEAFVRQLLRRDQKAGLIYWKNLLQNYETRAAIPSYGKPTEAKTKPFIRHTLDKTLTTLLRQLAAMTGVTLDTVMELGWGLTLQLFCRTEDVVFVRVVSGRDGSDSDNSNIVGLFINSVPVRVHTASTDTVTQSLKALQNQSAQSAAYNFCPLSEIQSQTNLGSSLFQSVVAFENYPIDDTLSNAKRRWDVKPVQVEEEPFGELAIVISPEVEGTLRLTFTYDTSLYIEQQMELVAKTYETLIRGMATMPNCQLKELPLVTQTTQTGLIELGRGEMTIWNSSDTLVSLFRQQAASTPDAIAVVCNHRQMTYRELDYMTDCLAQYLIKNYNVQSEESVGVMIDRSELLVVYPLAIMKAGGCYMPLDFTFPADRLQYMCEDAGVSLILSEGDLVAQAMPDFQGSVFTADELEMPHDPLALPTPAPRHRYVILYTSGSTGCPKGVVLEHHSIVNFCRWYNKEFRMTAADRVLGFSNFGFDAHMIDFYPALTCGASVYIITNEMRLDIAGMNRYMEENAVSTAFLTTQVGHLFVSSIRNNSLRLLLVGGERLMPVKKPPYEFYNGYGPTECTIFTTVYTIKDDYDSTCIGRPLPNQQLFVVDSSMRLLPRGIPGELVICGQGVARGYLHPEEQDVGKFTTFMGHRAYRTGDLVRWADDGNLEFLGRIDSQVKLRGLRIEMGEIEACASQFSGVGQTVAQVTGGQNICLYYTTSDDIDIGALKQHLADHLASYMVPTIYMQLDSMPLTPNGKIDKTQLPEPTRAVRPQGVLPHNEKETVLLLMVGHVLSREDFGITDDLFDLGLTSITAIQVAAMADTCGIHISINNLMRLRTIERLLADQTPIGYWFNTYSPEKPVLVVPHGVVPVISMTDKFHEWKDYFSIYTLEPTDEHAVRLSPGHDYDMLVGAYAEILDRDIPADARMFGFLGYSWGGELGYSLAGIWQQRHGGHPRVYLCDTFIHDPDTPKMTEEQISQTVFQYFMSHMADFDISALGQPGAEVNGNALDMALVKCGKDEGFAGEVFKIVTRKFLFGELYRRTQPLSKCDFSVTYFVAIRENPHMAENLSGWQKVAPTMKVISIDDNHMNFVLRNNNTHLVTKQLLSDLRARGII